MNKKILAIGSGLATLLALGQSTAYAAFITGPGDPDYSTAFQGASAATFAGLGFTIGTGASDLKVSTGTWTDPSGFTFGTVQTPLSAYDTASGHTFDKIGFGYAVDPTTAASGNSRDYAWLQNSGTNTTTNTALDTPWNGTIWDLGGQANQAVVFPVVDHAPLPQEAVEYTVYLTNDPTSTSLADWNLALLDQVYLQGWEADAISLADGFTTVWKLPGGATFRYVSVQGVGSQALQPIFGNEDEIDAVGGLTVSGGGLGCGQPGQPACPTPEPETLPLLGAGLIGLVMALRRKRQ